MQRAAAGEGEDHLAGRPVGLAHEREREFVRVEDGIALLLPAVAREALAEVAVAVEQADADERNTQVAGGLQMVSGKDAEPAGVLRQGSRHSELGREVGDGGGEPVALGALLLVPPGALQVLPEIGGHLGQTVQELLVPGQLGEASGGHGTEQAHGIALRRPAGHRVDGLEELTGLVVPGPAQVAREVAERLKGVGEDGTHGESTNGLHVFHLYRGRTNPRGRTAVCAAPSPSTVAVCGIPQPRRAAGSGCATPGGPAAPPPVPLASRPALSADPDTSVTGVMADSLTSRGLVGLRVTGKAALWRPYRPACAGSAQSRARAAEPGAFGTSQIRPSS